MLCYSSGHGHWPHVVCHDKSPDGWLDQREGNDCDDAYKVEHEEVGDSVAENVDGDGHLEEVDVEKRE